MLTILDAVKAEGKLRTTSHTVGGPETNVDLQPSVRVNTMIGVDKQRKSAVKT
jgi:hypothetical protein